MRRQNGFLPNFVTLERKRYLSHSYLKPTFSIVIFHYRKNAFRYQKQENKAAGVKNLLRNPDRRK